MNSPLVDATKEAIGYTEAPAPQCADCIHCKMVDGFVDRTWDYECRVSNLIVLNVKPDARCNHFKDKGIR